MYYKSKHYEDKYIFFKTNDDCVQNKIEKQQKTTTEIQDPG